MSLWRLVRRGIVHHWRAQLGVALGAAVAAAVLVGALAVGDSVRASLAAEARLRTGAVRAALLGGDRLFRATLADELRAAGTAPRAAAVLQLPGVASADGGRARTGIVDVLGVDAAFFALAPEPLSDAPAPGEVWIDARLARQLDVAVGAPLLLRVTQPTGMPRDMVMATVDDATRAVRATVARVVADASFGRFGLQAAAVPPFLAFVDRAWLAAELEAGDRANAILTAADDRAALDSAVRARVTLADLGLEVRALAPGVAEVVSERVFLDAPLVAAAAAVAPDALGVVAYFVNDVTAGENVAAYAMVAAVGPLGAAPVAGPLAELAALAPEPAGDAAAGDPAAGAGSSAAARVPVALSDWLAERLEVAVGADLQLGYYVTGPAQRLLTRTVAARVAAIRPVAGAAADPTLMPDFPGLADAESCRDWQPGVPIDLQRLDGADQEWWEERRGTPKAWLALADGRRLFGDRFGELTAIRVATDDPAAFATALAAAIDPARIGLFFRDVAAATASASHAATDFGGLFLGLSLFLIVAALLLTALLFAFGVEQRASELGVLRALGFRPAVLRRVVLGEALLVAALGVALGAALGLGYTRLVLAGLATLWRGAVGDTPLAFHVAPTTPFVGAAIALVAALLAIAFALRRALAGPALALLQSRAGFTPAGRGRPRRLAPTLGFAALAAGLAVWLVAAAPADATAAAGAFFGAGALALLAGLALCRALVARLDPRHAGARPLTSTFGLALRNVGRRPGRSLASIALLAAGTFLVVAIQANRLEPPTDVRARDAGTGGFALWGRTTLPVLRDLTTDEGRDAYALSDRDLDGVDIVPLRVRGGDDASCLNLAVPAEPELVGVEPAALASRGAFGFADRGGAPAGASPWTSLDAEHDPTPAGLPVVPAIGDAASVQWTMHKVVGDDVVYTADDGRPVAVRIVATLSGSILQGRLLIAARHFERLFPSHAGHRAFLIDAPPEREATVAARLGEALSDVGFEATATADRLSAYQAVQNTYLLIFQALGGLGLVLGSAGLGMVVLRNALERRSELAALRALGFRARAVRRLLLLEHLGLLALGLGVGVAAALLAVVPGGAGSGSGSGGGVAWVVVGVAVSGIAWVAIAARAATGGGLLRALRAGD